MMSLRTLRFLSKLAARELAQAEWSAADAITRLQALARDTMLLAEYTRGLSESLQGATCRGYDLKVTSGFVAASLLARAKNEAAQRQGEQVKAEAFGQLAMEMQRRDALQTARKDAAQLSARVLEQKAERLATQPSPALHHGRP